MRGTPERPRLSVFRSHKHIYVQVIDDDAGRTLAAASTVDKDLRGEVKYGGNKAAAASRRQSDRRAGDGRRRQGSCLRPRREYQYHGRVAALADAAREAGLSF